MSTIESTIEPRKPRRVAERREAPFVGSSRFYRGRIVHALREVPEGGSLPLDELGRQVKADYTESDEAWLRELAARLADDGLIAFDGTSARLPG